MFPFYLLDFFLIICMKHQTTTKNNNNNDIVYRLQARTKSSPLERKTLKYLLFLIDSSIDKFHNLATKTNTNLLRWCANFDLAKPSQISSSNTFLSSCCMILGLLLQICNFCCTATTAATCGNFDLLLEPYFDLLLPFPDSWSLPRDPWWQLLDLFASVSPRSNVYMDALCMRKNPSPL